MSLGSQIKYYRKLGEFSQEDLAWNLEVSAVTICNWEKGKAVPTASNLKQLAAVLNTTVDSLLNDHQFVPVDRIFDTEKMITFIRDKISSGKYPQLEKAMEFADNNFPRLKKRKGNILTRYERHPLNMVCHAFALGLDDDVLLAATLLHDAGEKLRRRLDVMALPVNVECIKIIKLLTKKEKSRYHEKEYYDGIRTNTKACLIKCLSHCNNLSIYTVGCKEHEVVEMIRETEKCIYPLLKIIETVPEYSNAAFLLSYQIKTQVENLKYFL